MTLVTLVLVISLGLYAWVLYKLVALSRDINDMRRRLEQVCHLRRLHSDNGKSICVPVPEALRR